METVSLCGTADLSLMTHRTYHSARNVMSPLPGQATALPAWKSLSGSDGLIVAGRRSTRRHRPLCSRGALQTWHGLLPALRQRKHIVIQHEERKYSLLSNCSHCHGTSRQEHRRLREVHSRTVATGAFAKFCWLSVQELLSFCTPIPVSFFECIFAHALGCVSTL